MKKLFLILTLLPSFAFSQQNATFKNVTVRQTLKADSVSAPNLLNKVDTTTTVATPYDVATVNSITPSGGTLDVNGIVNADTVYVTGNAAKLFDAGSYFDIRLAAAHDMRITLPEYPEHLGINRQSAALSQIYLGTDEYGNANIKLRGINAATNSDATENVDLRMNSGGFRIDVNKGTLEVTTSGAIYFDGGVFLYNTDNNADNDFRIDGLDTAGDNLFRTDAANRRVGISTGTPAVKLDVNGAIKSATGTIANNDATPSVSGYNTFIYAGSANAVTITDLDNPTAGVYYTLIGNSDTYTITIADAGNFNLGAQRVLGHDDVLVLYCIADNNYIEVSYTDN